MLIDKILREKESLLKGRMVSGFFFIGLDSAVNFFIPAHTRDEIVSLIGGVERHTLMENGKLPFPSCFFQIDINCNDGVARKVGLYARQSEENIDCLDVQCFVDEGASFSYDHMLYSINTKTKELRISVINKDLLRLNKDQMEERAYTVSDELCMVLYAINCSNLVEIKESKLAKLNKKLNKKGKQPRKNYSTITLKLTKEERASIRAEGSTPFGVKRRTHLRRGHFRNLPDKVVWVRNCVVGAGASVKPNYEVEK